jgi:2-polyprenyl-6-hydroxyphenyl methylase/3-demethylubiquinone-9 3-methyltransferase
MARLFRSSQVNNAIYDQLADTWWDRNGILYLLKAMVNPWRVPYFEQVIKAHYGAELSANRLLDVGCGGGVLTEEFARIGLRVTGIDTSARSIQAAGEHAESEGLEIDYLPGSALALNFPDNSFDVVSCCDVLEHIPDWEKVVAEIRRVLKPGGLFVFDTINRTPLSWLQLIIGLQVFPLTRLFPPDTHNWRMFIRPDELRDECKRNGLQVEEVLGGKLTGNSLIALRELRRYKRGAISAAELGKKLALRETENLSANYMGVAHKSMR